jgi:mannose-6-phosphate isomerase-like protein (cupin superfamily)
MDELKIRLERIRELTEVVVPFRETLHDTDILDADGSKKANMRYIYKDEDCAICMAYIEGGFTHSNHFHQEWEVLILLRGQALRIFEDHQDEMKIGIPMVVEPLEHHVMYYPIGSKILAITVPASRHFPNFTSHGKNE